MKTVKHHGKQWPTTRNCEKPWTTMNNRGRGGRFLGNMAGPKFDKIASQFPMLERPTEFEWTESTIVKMTQGVLLHPLNSFRIYFHVKWQVALKSCFLIQKQKRNWKHTTDNTSRTDPWSFSRYLCKTMVEGIIQISPFYRISRFLSSSVQNAFPDCNCEFKKSRQNKCGPSSSNPPWTFTVVSIIHF